MQDTELVERALVDFMIASEVLPTEGGHVEALASTMAKRVTELSRLRARKAKVVALNSSVVVRVPMCSSTVRRTVTAGVDCFQQVMSGAFSEIPDHLVPGAVAAVRPALAAQAERMEAEVSKSVERLTSDPVAVGSWKERLARDRAEKVRKEKENLVSGMLELLSQGWTRDMLQEALDAATCRSVLSS